jgi:hypothetical protein
MLVRKGTIYLGKSRAYSGPFSTCSFTGHRWERPNPLSKAGGTGSEAPSEPVYQAWAFDTGDSQVVAKATA